MTTLFRRVVGFPDMVTPSPVILFSFLSSFPKTKKKPKMKNRARLPRVAVAWIRNYLAELALYFGVGGKEEEGGG